MAIDYAINYLCEPKDQLTSEGILARLKGRQQAQRVISLYREAGDDRGYDQMGFEFTRNTPDGEEETQTILISDLMAAADQLNPLAHFCEGCPANISQQPFGCFGRIGYPLSDHGERWLLMQLPTPEQAPLVWTLLGENLRELNQYDAQVQEIRQGGAYFESLLNPRRRLGEIAMSGNNIFYLLFMQGHITPQRAGILLLFFGAIPRNLDAADIYKLSPPPADAATRYPFLIETDDEVDDTTVAELKRFLLALYTAWRLDVTLLMDV